MFVKRYKVKQVLSCNNSLFLIKAIFGNKNFGNFIKYTKNLVNYC